MAVRGTETQMVLSSLAECSVQALATAYPQRTGWMRMLRKDLQWLRKKAAEK